MDHNDSEHTWNKALLEQIDGTVRFECGDFEAVELTVPNGKQIAILSANYGSEGIENDVTAEVQALCQVCHNLTRNVNPNLSQLNPNGIQVGAPSFQHAGGIHLLIGDPEPGIPKRFVVHYTASGQMAVLNASVSQGAENSRESPIILYVTLPATAATAGEPCPGLSKVFESSHPYDNSLTTYETVCIPGAMSYSIRFSAESKTEHDYDYVRFYKSDAHSDYHGSNKYTGGRGDSSRNFPGTDGRPPLVITAPSFVLHFFSDGKRIVVLGQSST